MNSMNGAAPTRRKSASALSFRDHPAPLYVFAAACTGIATIITLLLRPFLEQGIFSLFLISVMASAWIGGLGPGLLASALSVLATDYFFIAPYYSFIVHSGDDIAQLIVFSLVAVLISVLQTAQQQARSALQSLNEKLEDRVRERTAWLSLVNDITGAAHETETVDQAFRFTLKRILTDSPWRYAQIYTRAPEDPNTLVPTHVDAASEDPRLLRIQDAAAKVRIPAGHGPVGRVLQSGGVEWISRLDDEPAYGDRGFVPSGLQTAVVFPVIADRKAVAVVECFSDTPRERDPQLSDLLGAVGIELGMIFERKQLQESYAEAIWQQQRRTAQELHDGLGQQLTGLWLMSTSLAGKLKETDHGPLAGKLADGIEQALEQIRGLAKGVFPVDLDPEGLMSALKDLAESMQAASGVTCRFECPDPVLLEDNRVAMHLYRIAQEAIANALKHGKPREVVTTLRSTSNGIQLRVADDGTGIPAFGDRKEGTGLRIMRYRAAAMDAVLKVESNGGRGTLVTCLSPRGAKG